MLATLKFINLSPSLSLQGKNIISMLSPSPGRWALTSIYMPTEQKEGLSFISSEHSSSNYAEKLSSSNYLLLVIRCLVYDALALLPTTGESGREADWRNEAWHSWRKDMTTKSLKCLQGNWLFTTAGFGFGFVLLLIFLQAQLEFTDFSFSYFEIFSPFLSNLAENIEFTKPKPQPTKLTYKVRSCM